MNFSRYDGSLEEHFPKSSKMKKFLNNFQHAITWLNFGKIFRSQTFLEFSCPELQDSDLTC